MEPWAVVVFIVGFEAVLGSDSADGVGFGFDGFTSTGWTDVSVVNAKRARHYKETES